MKYLSNFLRFGAVLFTSLTILSGCGGGGGSSSPPPQFGALRVTVSDEYGIKVAGATVQATAGTTSESWTTDDQGVATLPPLPVGSASVTVSRATFLPQTINVLIENGKFKEQPVTLIRATSAAGGSMTSRGDAPVVHTTQSMTFEVELVIVDVVDGEPTPITGLTADKFSLLACPSGNVSVTCVRGASSATYTVTSVEILSPVTPVGAPVPYAAALMLDQSGSIYASDPTGARLYSAKSFLGQLGNDDWVLLSAFADDGVYAIAKIPNTPLTVYPSFRSKFTLAGAPSYFSTLDSLAALVGGNTPLYAALDSLVAQVASANLPAGIAKSVVIFTDGDDTYCHNPDACRTRRQASITAANTAGVRIFTIGLSSSVNFEALGELANQTGGAFLYAENVEQLIPLYGTVGKLLSLSLPTYRLKFTVNADSPAFQSGNALFGRVEVSVPSNPSFVVPFIVGIP